MEITVIIIIYYQHDYDKQIFEIKTGLDKLVEEKLNFTKTFSILVEFNL